VVVPVSDVDKAKDFYQALGWRLDADFVKGEDFRVVQLTPPGSFVSFSDPDHPGGHHPSSGPLRPMPAETGPADADWPSWYAQYMVDEQAGHRTEAAQGAST
jgi:catechol 2,3-dioxygenase-like lactoylglutathione lyase family enzyme